MTMLLLAFTMLMSVLTPPELVVSPATLTFEVGETYTMTATLTNAEGEAVTDADIRWFSSDRGVVQIDRETGVAEAIAPGNARVIALTFLDGTRLTAEASLTVPDLPPAVVEASLHTDQLRAGTSAPLKLHVADRRGEALPHTLLSFQTSDASVATVDGAGRVAALQPGSANIRVQAGDVETVVSVSVEANDIQAYELVANTDALPIEVRTGDVVRFHVEGVTASGTRVDDLMPGWAVGPRGASVDEDGADGVFVADTPGTYRVTALIGPENTQTAIVNVTPRTYNATLTKVGRGPIAGHNSADTWVFEGVDGRDYAYIGTFMHDWMMAWDVTDPTNPVLTDSIQVDARRINDVKIHPNNRIAIITREGASSRRNGIVLLDLSEPAHPTILSEYTDTVTGGVHNVWIVGEEDIVYAVHNGTSDVHIIDIADPENPKEIGRWGLDKDYGKTLHDVIVQDGYAYLSYWDDGVITLDAGAGTHGGTLREPTFVSQYKYPIGHTHTAWRDGRYLFVGDEIFPSDWDKDSPIEARGYIHVLDMTDMDNPVEVAKYEVPEAGAHNVWVEDDKLYVGYYQGGLRVVDISGELRGDLYQQGREMAALRTTDADTVVPNWPFTFSAQIFKGLIYSADFNSGLWITRLDEDPITP